MRRQPIRAAGGIAIGQAGSPASLTRLRDVAQPNGLPAPGAPTPPSQYQRIVAGVTTPGRH